MKKRFRIFSTTDSNNRLREDSREMNISSNTNFQSVGGFWSILVFFFFRKSKVISYFIIYNLKFDSEKSEKKLFGCDWENMYDHIVDWCFKNWCFCSVIIITRTGVNLLFSEWTVQYENIVSRIDILKGEINICINLYHVPLT